MYLTGLTSPVVRDLAWVMAGPSLLSQASSPFAGEKVSNEWCAELYYSQWPWLQHLDRDPAPLSAWMAQYQSPMLGRYFETLIAFWLKHLPETELLAQNLIVGERVRQMGEFDFLFKQQQQFFHWEVAVKFYLLHEGRFLGPNPRDSLDKKLNRVFRHQLCLSQHPLARQVLRERIGTDQVRAQAFIKGYLFYPAGQNLVPPEPGIAADHLRGEWLRPEQLLPWLQQRGDRHRWCLLERLQWLAPAWRESDRELLDKAQLMQRVADYFVDHINALLVAEMEPVDNGWEEVARLFVVDQHWPRIAAKSKSNQPHGE